MSAPLDGRRAALVDLSAALGTGDEVEIARALDRAAAGAAPAEVEETLLQAHLFVGFPTVLNALAAWRGAAGPADGAGGPPMELAERRRRGEALCRRVYGAAYAKLRRNVRALHPDLDRWMVEEGYGRVLSRDGLDPVTRELCVVGLLAAGGHRRQLRSHLEGALNVGATTDAVRGALEAGLARVRDPVVAAELEALWTEP